MEQDTVQLPVLNEDARTRSGRELQTARLPSVVNKTGRPKGKSARPRKTATNAGAQANDENGDENDDSSIRTKDEQDNEEVNPARSKIAEAVENDADNYTVHRSTWKSPNLWDVIEAQNEQLQAQARQIQVLLSKVRLQQPRGSETQYVGSGQVAASPDGSITSKDSQQQQQQTQRPIPANIIALADLAVETFPEEKDAQVELDFVHPYREHERRDKANQLAVNTFRFERDWREHIPAKWAEADLMNKNGTKLGCFRTAITPMHSNNGYDDKYLTKAQFFDAVRRILKYLRRSMTLCIHEISYECDLGFQQTEMILHYLGVIGLRGREAQTVRGYQIIADCCLLHNAEISGSTPETREKKHSVAASKNVRDCALRNPSGDAVFHHFMRHIGAGGYKQNPHLKQCWLKRPYVELMRNMRWPGVAGGVFHQHDLRMRRYWFPMSAADNEIFFVQRTLDYAVWLGTFRANDPRQKQDGKSDAEAHERHAQLAQNYSHSIAKLWCNLQGYEQYMARIGDDAVEKPKDGGIEKRFWGMPADVTAVFTPLAQAKNVAKNNYVEFDE